MTTAADLRLAITKAFPSPAHRVFFEVGNDTGHKVSRHADAVALGIWPSTGHAVHGFEIKISRGDFLREMADPGKSMPIFRFCHRWSLVVPAGLVLPKELPPGWGLYELTGERLKARVRPDLLKPDPITPGFVAALVRRAGEADAHLIDAATSKVDREWRAKFDDEVKRRIDRQSALDGDHRRRLIDKVRKIEEISGLKLDDWCDGEAIGRAVKAVHEAGVEGTYKGLAFIARELRESADRIERARLGAAEQSPLETGREPV